jgi:energy-coupling factor transport system substrate-specific component
VSWLLASFLLVGLVLGVGWLVYERRRPSARMVAVVATLAAVAALGRDAFVALPDVKPITAMALVVGYALGPLPGFTVGALGMLAANMLLGQGPYTPWQMAAWGMVGLAGAALGWLSRRRMGRVGLALACALAALAAKEVMNVYTWTLGASHTPAAFLAVAASALPFDVTDMVASLFFGLAFGPELARLLARVRARMDVSWEAPQASPGAGEPPARPSGLRSLDAAGALVAALLAGALLVVGGPRAAASASRARVDVSRELAYLTGAQNADGGFGGARGQSSSELYSAWAAMGLAAAGRDPLSVRHAGHSVLDVLRGEASSLQGAGDLERTILALHACGVSVHSLPGGDPVARLLRLRAGDGSFGHLSNLTAFAIFALRAAGYPAGDPKIRAAGRWLSKQQNTDGGFGFGARGGSGDVDDTAAALEALVEAGLSKGPLPTRAVAFLLGAQNLDGGYPQELGGQSNAQSTAWAIQGLIAGGRDVSAVTREGSRPPLGYLESLVAPDGSVRYSRTGAQSPVWVTAQALTALAEKPLPIAAPTRSRASAVHAAAISPSGRGRGVATAPVAARTRRLHAGSAPASNARAQEHRLDVVAHSVGALVGVLLSPMLR